MVNRPNIQKPESGSAGGGAVEEMGFLYDGFWLLNGRERSQTGSWLNPATSLSEASREIAKLHLSSGLDLFALEPDRQCNRLIMNEFLFEWKTSGLR
jgi:hypothetical protein